MQELFCEESAIMRDDRRAKRWYNIFRVVSIIGFVLGSFVLLMLLMLLLMPVDADAIEEAGGIDTTALIIQIVVFLVIAILLFLTGALFKVKKHKFFLSYDYTYVNGELRLAKVIHDRKRKILYRLLDEQILQIGRVGSDSYDKLKHSPDCKEEILTPNEEAADEKEFFYIQAATKVGKRLLILECRLNFIATVYKNNQNRRILEPDFNRKNYSK